MLTSPDVSCSVATHLENLENLQKSGNLRVFCGQGEKEMSVQMCCCAWSITTRIVLDTKYARKELFTR